MRKLIIFIGVLIASRLCYGYDSYHAYRDFQNQYGGSSIGEVQLGRNIVEQNYHRLGISEEAFEAYQLVQSTNLDNFKNETINKAISDLHSITIEGVNAGEYLEEALKTEKLLPVYKALETVNDEFVEPALRGVSYLGEGKEAWQEGLYINLGIPKNAAGEYITDYISDEFGEAVSRDAWLHSKELGVQAFKTTVSTFPAAAKTVAKFTGVSDVVNAAENVLSAVNISKSTKGVYFLLENIPKLLSFAWSAANNDISPSEATEFYLITQQLGELVIDGNNYGYAADLLQIVTSGKSLYEQYTKMQSNSEVLSQVPQLKRFIENSNQKLAGEFLQVLLKHSVAILDKAGLTDSASDFADIGAEVVIYFHDAQIIADSVNLKVQLHQFKKVNTHIKKYTEKYRYHLNEGVLRFFAIDRFYDDYTYRFDKRYIAEISGDLAIRNEEALNKAKDIALESAKKGMLALDAMGNLVAKTQGLTSHFGSADYFMSSTSQPDNTQYENHEYRPMETAQENPYLESGSVIIEAPADIVLAWGSTPADLDSHLTGPMNSTGSERFHTSFSDRGSLDSQPNVMLYTDNTTHGVGGDNSPEQTRINVTQPGKYNFYVHDFSNRTETNSTAMSNSGAVVSVHTAGSSNLPEGNNLGEKVAEYNIPTNQVGTAWHTFELDTVRNTIKPVNEFQNVENPDNVPFND